MKKKILNSESIPDFNESINSLSKERKDYIDKQIEMIAEEKKIIQAWATFIKPTIKL